MNNAAGIKVIRIDGDCQLQVDLSKYGIPAADQKAIAVTIAARSDVRRADASIEGRLTVTYNPAGLNAEKRAIFISDLIDKVIDVIDHKIEMLQKKAAASIS